MNDQSLEQLLHATALRSDMSTKYACLIQFRNKLLPLDIIIIIREIVAIINIVFYEANKYSTHAEKSALQQVRNKSILKYCKAYIIKIKNNEIVQANPCEMCCKLLKKYGIKIASAR